MPVDGLTWAFFSQPAFLPSRAVLPLIASSSAKNSAERSNAAWTSSRGMPWSESVLTFSAGQTWLGTHKKPTSMEAFISSSVISWRRLSKSWRDIVGTDMAGASDGLTFKACRS